MSKKIHVGIVGGFDLAGNVRTLLENIRNLLSTRSNEYDFDILLSEDIESPDGFNKVPIDTDSTTARGKIRKLVSEIYAYANTMCPDILVQVTRFPIHGTAVALAGKASGTPTITRIAGEEFSEYKHSQSIREKLQLYMLKNVVGQIAVHLSDTIIVLGSNAREALATRHRRRGVWEIPQPIDRRHFNPVGSTERHLIRDQLDIPRDSRMLLTVGRVTRRKGAETIRRVAPKLPSDTIWFIVGEGPMRAQLSNIENVETRGRVPHEQMPKYYQTSDLYVHPSLHDGLPNVLLEAAACGTPSVARDVGECNTIATETFRTDCELLSLLDREYETVVLDNRFNEDHLAEQYDSLLTEVAY